MRKFFASLLMLIYLLSFPQVQQLMKLPELVQHFIQHKNHNPETTVYSFIKIHYLDAPIKDDDWKDDMKLPFKSHDFPPQHSHLRYHQESWKSLQL